MADATTPRASLRGAIDAKCKACGGTEGGERRWREYVAACPITDCALWIVRPMPDRCPAWLASRDPDQLPPGWRAAPMIQALAAIRGTDATKHPVTTRSTDLALDLRPEATL